MIKQFKNEYSWLSNFYECKVTMNGLTYSTVENAYHSQKDPDNISWALRCTEEKPGIIKEESRNLSIDIKEWDQRKLKVMEELLIQKFNQEPFKTLLLNTGDEEIQEGNYWNDEFWGINLKTGKGKNHLGKMIMKIRDRLNNTLF